MIRPALRTMLAVEIALLLGLLTGCRTPCLRGPQAGPRTPDSYALNNTHPFWTPSLKGSELVQPGSSTREDIPPPVLTEPTGTEDASTLGPDDAGLIVSSTDPIDAPEIGLAGYVRSAGTNPEIRAELLANESLVESPSDRPATMESDSADPLPNPIVPSFENSADLPHQIFFDDPYLLGLIQQALSGNQELRILAEEIRIASNEAYARSGEYRPFVTLGAGAAIDKPGEYTRAGAVEQQLEVAPGRKFPEPLPDFLFGADVSWEIDIWKRLRNLQRAATMRYLGTREGRNFVVTRLVAEIAESYFELLALDSRRLTLDKTIEIQLASLQAAKAKKEAGRGTELAVQRFQAEVHKNQSEQSVILQEIVEVENRINFLVGRYPQPVDRADVEFVDLHLNTLHTGVPSQLLQNRADIRQAEREVAAAGLDVRAARARFYPSLSLTAGLGWNAFSTGYLFQSPESLIYGVAGEIVGPLINRRAIKADYNTANSIQLQSIYNYQQTILEAHIEVVNYITKVENYRRSINSKKNQLASLEASVDVANKLFQSARAEYVEVLLAQRELMEARMQLIETKKEQLSAIVNAYQALGGGF